MVGYLNAYFFPHPVRAWNADSIRQAHQIAVPLHRCATVFKVIGLIGIIFAGYKMMLTQFSAVPLNPSLIVAKVIFLSLITLGIGLNHLSRQSFQGLTDEQCTAIALEALKDAFAQLPVCQSEEELKDKLEHDIFFKSTLARRAIQQANQVKSLAYASYRPTKEVRPHFGIKRGLNLEQKLELLEVCYQKGIILHFDDYRQLNPYRLFYPMLKALGDKQEQAILQQSFKCSVYFLKLGLQSSSQLKKMELINEQLCCLSPRWYVEGEVKMLHPIVYLEDDETIAIRARNIELDELIWAIEQVALHASIKKIKIEKKFSTLEKASASCHLEAWRKVREVLNHSFAGEVLFVDKLEKMPSAWHDKASSYYTLKEVAEDMVEDIERKHKILTRLESSL